MYYIGIDIGRGFNYLGIFNDKKKLVTKHLKFNNSKTGFERVISYLKSNKVNKNNCFIFMESTGHYHINLFNYLHDKGYKVAITDPANTKSVSHSVAKGNKNDKVDCLKIVIAAKLYEPGQTLPVNDEILQLRKLTRERDFLVKQQSNYKRKLIALLDQSFPEYLGGMFRNLNNNTAIHLLIHYQSASDFSKAHLEKLTSLLKKYSRGRYSSKHASTLKSIAHDSISRKSNTKADSEIILAIARSLLLTMELISNLENSIGESPIVKQSKITTIPGIGPTIAATLLAETGDISRFANADCFVSYAGLGVLDNESGKTYKRKHISKSGNEHIRTAIYMAAQICATTNLDPYFDAKLAEYKTRMTHKEAVVVLSRKMLRIAYSIMKNDTAFISPKI